MFRMTQIDSAMAAHLSLPRYEHSRGVAETAATLAEQFGADPAQARLAGYLHDYAREIEPGILISLAQSGGLEVDPVECRAPLLLHGKVGAMLARERFGLDQPEILAAIALHITGAPGLSTLAKVIFVADFIEPGRVAAWADPVRREARSDLDRAVCLAMEKTMGYVVSRGYQIHPRTAAAYNEYLWLIGRRMEAGN